MNLRKPIYLLLAVFFAIATTSVAQAAKSVGAVVKVSQGATIRSDGDNARLSEGTEIFVGDMIITNKQGSVQLLFNDNTKIVVGPGSKFVVDDIVMKASNKASKFSVNALGGTFRFLSGKSAKKTYRIKTPTATMGIRGTEFDFHVVRNRLTDVIVFSGTVLLCSDSGDCEELSEVCELANAKRSRPSILTVGRNERNEAIQSNFPYIVSQQPLREEFKVDTSKCGNIKVEKEQQKVTPPASEPEPEPKKPEPKPKPTPKPQPEPDVEPEPEPDVEPEPEPEPMGPKTPSFCAKGPNGKAERYRGRGPCSEEDGNPGKGHGKGKNEGRSNEDNENRNDPTTGDEG